MTTRKMLLISNSTNAGEAFLKYPLGAIKVFLEGIKKVLFVPYAAVTFSFDDYLDKVRERFEELGIAVESVHAAEDALAAVREAEAVVVGGGNTFQLVAMMQEQGLIEAIAARVEGGMPYVGWSAGSNVACPRLCTTNDMPIVEPSSFETMNLVPFQINPHYVDARLEGHAGETREDRINEFVAVNKAVRVVGLREGTMLCLSGGRLRLIGSRSLRVFEYGRPAREFSSGDDLDFLLEN